MDAEIGDSFFVTLPSNSSLHYFPTNTQSSFRTKLTSPLVLSGQWEVGLAELCMPRNWFNVNKENSTYSVVYESEELVKVKHLEYRIQLEYEREMDRDGFCILLNDAIRKVMGEEFDSVYFFSTQESDSTLTVVVKEGYELLIKPKGGRKLLYMLRLSIEDVVLTGKNTYRYRASNTIPQSLSFTILQKTHKSIVERIVPLSSIKDNKPMNTMTDLIHILDHNLKLLELGHLASFHFSPSKSELTVIVSDDAEFILSEDTCPSLLKKFNLKGSTIIKKTQTFSVDVFQEIALGEVMKLRIFEYNEKRIPETKQEDLTIPVGMYKTPQELFKSIRYVNLRQLPDLKVHMTVPIAHEITFAKGLSDMLGFNNTTFKSGTYVSDYPLELDGGITEIFIYCGDLISSHHCGDNFLPLLRIVPCMGEKGEQIVKNYVRPLYFPVRKNFIETIQIEFKSSSGNDIIFSGGKTYVVLSFRRRKV